MWRERLATMGAGLLDLLYPRVCQYCGTVADATRFYCWNCLSEFTYVQAPFCSICGDPVPGHIDHEYTCGFCARQTPRFELARSAVRYAGPVGSAIRALKYHAATWLIPDLTDLLEACCRAHYSLLTFDALCYVPLFPVKQRERGFNQAALLAGDLAGRLGLPLARRALRRIRDSDTQTHLTASQRISNVWNAFDVSRNRVAGRQLLLIDDVMTTGATVNECARMLKAAGAVSVYVLTVARG